MLQHHLNSREFNYFFVINVDDKVGVSQHYLLSLLDFFVKNFNESNQNRPFLPPHPFVKINQDLTG